MSQLESRFPDIALLEAFSIFDTEIMESQSEYELLQKLETVTDHYGPHHVIDANSTVHEYKCFLRSVLSTPNLKSLSTQDIMSKLNNILQLKDIFPVNYQE